MTDDLTSIGEGYVVVSRNHTGGRISAACFLVDAYCVGVKDSFYRLRMEEEDFYDLIETIGADECSYEEAHNWIYGAIAFAEEAGIKPDASFALTQYMLEEDTEDIPLIGHEFGRDGMHFLAAKNKLEASRYLPLLKKNLGDNFDFYIDDVDDESDYDADEFDFDWDDDTFDDDDDADDYDDDSVKTTPQ